MIRLFHFGISIYLLKILASKLSVKDRAAFQRRFQPFLPRVLA